MKIFKKVLAMFLCFAMIFGFASMVDVSDLFKAEAATDSGKCGENLTYTFDDTTGELIISGTGAMTDLSNPSHGPWYGYRSSIKSVTIGNGVTSIGDSAFYDFDSLTSVTIPDSVTSIGNFAFYNCKSLADVTIPDNVTSIGSSAFYYCNSLTSITIPDGVTSICNYTFYHCESLTSVTLPDSITSIGNDAFYWCRNLSSIEIPDGVTIIGDYAFSDCKSLTAITIPDSVTSIGNQGFYGCDELKSITIPGSVKSVGDNAFFSCNELKSVTIHDGVTSIGKYAFGNCEEIESVTLPDSVTSIGYHAFEQCKNLTFIKIPAKVSVIDEKTFSYCWNMASISIPVSVTSIESGAFNYCNGLEDVYYAGSQADWSKISIGENNGYLQIATIHYNHVHDYSTLVVKKPTCTEKGEGIFTCECGDKYTDKLPELKHDIVIDEAVESTCTETGLTAGQHCSRCDDATVSQEVVPTIPHNFAGTYNSEKHWQECYCGEAVAERDHIFTSGNTCGCGYKRVSDAVISINNNTGSKTINYGETLKLTAVVTNKPADAVVVWYVNGIKSAVGETFFIGFDGGTKTVEVKLLDSNGIVYEDANDNEISDSQTVTVKNGFFQKIISFFKNLFGMNRTVIQAIYKGIF